MTPLLCPFNHTALASDAVLKLRDVPIGFGEVVRLVKHAGGLSPLESLLRIGAGRGQRGQPHGIESGTS
jgi:hypothetical protein